MDKLYKQFTDPDAFYRTAPFWIWNEEMDPAESERQLKEFKTHGMGGAFSHVRTGLITPYLEEEYMDVFGKSIEAAKELGIKLYMYDEYGWPSGAANGEVIEAVPEARYTWMYYDKVSSDDPAVTRGDARVYAFDPATNTVGKELTGKTKDEIKALTDNVIVTYIKAEGGTHPFVDLSKPEVTKKFIEITHEKYYEYFGKDFKDNLMAMFSDESSIEGLSEEKIAYNDTILKKFKEMHGYSLEDNYVAVFEDFNGGFDHSAAKVRYDYCCTLHELWIGSFVKPIADWCEEHDIAWTGHDQEHSWPQTRGGAFSEQTTYEYRQWPGIDMLLCDALREVPAWNDTLLLNEVRSAANQFNKKRTICEAYGAAGWHSTFRDYKRLGDWIMVNGINFMIQHLSLYSLVGSRKRDCPQSFDWREPWWDEYTEYNDYFGRLSYMLSQGKMEQRILVLNPSTTGYMIPAAEQKGMINHSFTFDVIKNPDMSDLLRINQKLIDEQWDFDYGDEFSMERHAHVEGNKLAVGAQKYDIVVISKNMRNIRKETAFLLIDFAKAGGTIIATGDAGEFISGEKNEALTEEMRKGWTFVEGENGVNDFISARLERRVTADKTIPTGFTHMRRLLDDGREAYFFVNHTMKPFEAKITLNGNSVAKWDLFTGERTGISAEVKDGKLTFDLSLEWNQSLMVVVGDSEPVSEAKPEAKKSVALNLEGVLPEKPNNMLLDHCVLKTNKITTNEIYFMEHEKNLPQQMNLGRTNVWEGCQFRRESLDMQKRVPEDQHFEIIYKFTIKEGALPEKLTAVVERPEFVKLSVNGKEVIWKGDVSYLDYKIGNYDITEYVHEGSNELVVWNDKYDVRFEPAAVILEGSFGLEAEGERFVIGKKPQALNLGSWLDQKYIFYPNAMIYTFKANLDKKPLAAKLVMGRTETSCASVTVNGKYLGVIGRDGDDYSMIEDALEAGENEIKIRVCGSFRNLYGPYFNYLDQTVADYGQFKNYAKNRINRPEEYDVIAYGMYEMPKLLID